MLAGVERLVDLVGVRSSGLVGASPDAVHDMIASGDVNGLAATDGHFAGAARSGQTVRLARTIGIPLRYFVAKMFHGPFLVVSDRIDSIYDWCCEQKIGWQFDPAYTRMVPAHYITEIEQIGCPDPAPVYRRFFAPAIGAGSADVDEAGPLYVDAAYRALRRWLELVPPSAAVGVAFSGGIDSTSVLILAARAFRELGRDMSLLRAFTLDMGGGRDAEQAQEVARALGLEKHLEIVRVDPAGFDPANAIRVIEDYHPLDVECAAVALCLLQAIRSRYPEVRYLLDGDGGDENMKSYPLEDSDLTLSSILRNPMLYQEGWGVDAIKHSLTYSGGLSRSYVRTCAPARQLGFNAFSPYSVRSVIAQAVNLPFEQVLNGSVERLYSLKGDMVRSGVRAVAGVDMPVSAKRRFQDGARGDTYREWKLSKAWCRQLFLRQWEERLRAAWDPQNERVSGNDISAPLPR